MKDFGLLFRSSKLRLLSSPIIETIGVSMAVMLQKFDHTRVSKLKTSFINPKTRPKVISKKYLIRFT